MSVRRKTYRLRHGDVIDVEEYHDGRYGAGGERRKPRKKPSKDAQARVNAENKARRCRQRLLQYFDAGDVFATWTYRVDERPSGMDEALKDFQAAMRRVRREYKKRGRELFWIRNIEKGTKGAWHIHLVVNEIGDTAGILERAWTHGGIYISRTGTNDKVRDEDFTKLADYMTKDSRTREEKKDGTEGKPRIAESSFGTSRNMPLPEPKVEKLVRWKPEPKPRKGYYIVRIHEGVNPVTGYMYRRYTMIRLRKGT